MNLATDFHGFPVPRMPRLAYMVSEEMQGEMHYDTSLEANKVASDLPKCTEEQRLTLALYFP